MTLEPHAKTSKGLRNSSPISDPECPWDILQNMSLHIKSFQNSKVLKKDYFQTITLSKLLIKVKRRNISFHRKTKLLPTKHQFLELT